eukprot:5585679-Amphidinium_carterae.1
MQDSQIEIGQEAMKRAAASRKLWDSPAFNKLKEEASKGKSTVMVNPNGQRMKRARGEQPFPRYNGGKPPQEVHSRNTIGAGTVQNIEASV